LRGSKEAVGIGGGTHCPAGSNEFHADTRDRPFGTVLLAVVVQIVEGDAVDRRGDRAVLKLFQTQIPAPLIILGGGECLNDVNMKPPD
jgi:hypothetical protein